MNDLSTEHKRKPTVSSLFAGIGGFDIGFENAGFTTSWQVEIHDVARAVLADRFPHAKQHRDVRTCLPDLSTVDVIVGGFPCQDVSLMGKRRGFEGERTSLFFNAMHIVTQLSPRWLVLENVCGLFSSNNGLDFQKVIETLAECGYVGFWRVLDARYFGVPTKRRRVFIFAGLGEYPPMALMGDAGPVELNGGTGAEGTAWENAAPTLLAGLRSGSAIDLGFSSIIAMPNGRDKMVERWRTSENHGFCRGLAPTDVEEARGAGNAVVPAVAEWIARKLIKTFE